ncbi:brorin isoform X3 [Biomphalaria glabrata]|uniref:VWFC domain-containing protein n=1 Tax=Biomphalaria glabrata TaxID=6526 RepID=A0A2C9LIE3_BIOGL|nr:brorin isoform X3 [Biomphalaria glabrata]
MVCRFTTLCFCLLFIGHTWSWLFASGIRKARSPLVHKRSVSSENVQICNRFHQNNYPVACYMCSNCSQDQSEHQICMHADCRSQQCADFVVSPGACCATCPNGPNCWVENRLIPMGNVVSFPNGTTCNCIYGSYQVVRTQCSYFLNGASVVYFHGPEYASWL